MRHDWIFDVLTDLYSYAEANGLTNVAVAVDAALRAAKREIGTPDPDAPPSPPGRKRRPH
jgi:hypothetical protein